MARNKEIQFSFAGGMLDPELAPRGDAEVYYAGALDLTNFTIDPRGGAEVREGSRFLDVIGDAAAGYLLFPFVFEPVTQVYLLLFTDLRLRVYRNDAMVADIATPFAAAILSELSLAQNFDSLIVTHQTLAPRIVQRQGSHAAWAISTVPQNQVWEAKFRRTFPSVAITPAATSGSGVTLTAASAFWRAEDVGAKITGNSGAATIAGYTSATEVSIDIATPFASTAAIPAFGWIFDQTDCTVSPAADITPDKVSGAVVKITASQNVFRPHHVGGTITGNSGVAVITVVNSESEVEAETSTPFASTAAITSGNWTLSGIDLVEPAWSARRGWPASAGFHGGRLVFAGPRDLPNRAFGSRVLEPFDHEATTDAFDDDPVAVELSSGVLARIRHVYSLDGLHLLTGDGVFSQKEQPVTPANFAPQRQAAEPASAARPVTLESAMVYVQQADNGRGITIQEVVYDEVRQAFGGQDLTAFNVSIIDDPHQLTVRRGNESDSATHLLAVNADGSIAVLNSRRRQNLAAWTRWRTAEGDRIVQATALGGSIYWLAERQVDGSTVYYLEKMDTAVRSDSAIVQTAGSPKTDWDGLDHLEGRTVTLKADGKWVGSATVASGEVTLTDPATTLEAGLPRAWRLESMPVLRLANDVAPGKSHRIYRANIMVRNAQSLTVDGRAVSLRTFGPNVLDQPVQGYTGNVRVQLNGWHGGRRGRRDTLVIEGDAPLFTRIDALTLEIAS